MRSFTLPIPTLLAGFVAVLVGYAGSAAIIWQAAAAAGADAAQIAGWMTALGLAMGVSTLVLTLWRKVPILTAWSTPCAALLVSGLQGATLAQAVGIFVFANALILLCGVTGLFARLMKIIPHSLAAAMLAGILLRFGLQAFGSLQDNLPLCGGMFAAAVMQSALPTFCGRCGVSGRRDHCPANRRAVASGKRYGFCCSAVDYAAVHPFATAQRRCTVFPCHHGVTECARPGDHSGIRLSGSGLAANRIYRRAGVVILTIWRLFRVHRRHYRRDLPKSDAHPDADKRWLAAAAAGVFICWRGYLAVR